MLIVAVNRIFISAEIAKFECLLQVFNYFKSEFNCLNKASQLHNLNKVIIKYTEYIIRIFSYINFSKKDLTVDVKSLNDFLKNKVVVIKDLILIIFLILTSCTSISPRLDTSKNPTCSLDFNEESNYFDNSSCIKYSGSFIESNLSKQTHTSTYKVINDKKFLKRIYQQNYDQVLPGAKYFMYLKNIDEKWNIYEGVWRHYINPRNGLSYETFNDNSHVLLKENVERTRLPIEIQKILNDLVYDGNTKQEVVTKNTLKGLASNSSNETEKK